MKIEPWLREVESTVMTKSYKMVLLLVMLERGPAEWMKPITPQEAAPLFHRYLIEKEYRKKIDFSDGETLRLREYDEDKVAKLIQRMPMTKWSGSSKGLVKLHNGLFSVELMVEKERADLLYEWTKDICLYRLQGYFERRG